MPPLFLTPKELSCACAVGVVSLISGVTDVVILSFYFGTAQLLPLTLSLKCRGEKLDSNLTPLDKRQLLRPAVHLPLPSDPHPSGGDASFSSLFSSYALSSVLSFLLRKLHSLNLNVT